MELTKEERSLFDELKQKILNQKARDTDCRNHYYGKAKIEHLGISIPQAAEKLAFYPNWIATYVRVLEERMDVRLLVRQGTIDEDEKLRKVWQDNQLDLYSHSFHTDLLVYGRAIITVSRTTDGRPRIVVENPTNFSIKSDIVTGETTGALRMYQDKDENGLATVTHYAMYSDKEIIIFDDKAAAGVRGATVKRIPHYLGRVPVVMAKLINDTMDTQGHPIAEDLFKITELAGRTIMLLQLAMETVAAPQKIASGVTEKDFQNPDGTIDHDKWNRYFGSIWAVNNTDAKVTQLPGADLSGFLKTIDMLVEQASAVTGLPARLFGRNTVNPASEGAIRAEEARLVRTVERVNTAAGAAWAWALGIALRIINGEWEDSSVDIVWQNPTTPTESQQADRLQKLTGGKPVMSVRGAIEEMPWSALRKQKELEWLQQEAEEDMGYAAMEYPGTPYDE